MSQRFQFVTVDTIISKYLRDFRGMEFSEDDAIEWIGEALGFMKVTALSEEVVAFLEVKNYQAPLPNGLQYIIQVARNNSWSPTDTSSCTPESTVSSLEEENCKDCVECGGCKDYITLDCEGRPIDGDEIAYYRPYFDLQYEYMDWVYSKAFRSTYTPVRLSNHNFFNSIVCTENEEMSSGLYSSVDDEYTVVDNQLRFSFKEGFVALSYLRSKSDPDTGYPLVPDNEAVKAAITYYIGWKTKERECWNHREGACQIAQIAEQRYLKYIKQAKNSMKMPFGLDEHQNLMEQGNYVLPNHKRYYGFFGNLGKAEDRVFNDPTFSNKYRYTMGNNGYRM